MTSTLAIIAIVCLILITGVVLYQFFMPIYITYETNQKIQDEKHRTTDPKLVEGMNKYLNNK